MKFFLSSGTDRDQLKQILTIYNPYDFPIKFRGRRKYKAVNESIITHELNIDQIFVSVLSTTPDYYHVLSPEGAITSKNCVDLIIRLTAQVPTSSVVPLESKFRVQVFHYSTKQVLGRKDVPSTIIFGSGHASSDLDSDTFPNVSPDSGSGISSAAKLSRRQHRSEPPPLQEQYAQPNNTNYVAIITGIVCIIGLLLPLDKDEPSTVIPTYMHLSVNQKLLVAYTLGLVTMVLFRP